MRRHFRCRQCFSSSVSRSYYAMFFLAEALLWTKGLTFRSHRGVIAAFGEHFIKTGLAPATLGRDLARAFEKRQLADYEHASKLTRDDAAKLLEAAHEFLGWTQTFLGASPP